jgi:RimJ/RimL family protein N-acetyltransferase
MTVRTYFLKTDRIGFSGWTETDLPLAQSLWGDPQVTKYICASGSFSKSDIENRLGRELDNQEQFGIQYWPVFELASGALIGCCGLRPYGQKQYELGFHLRPRFWGQGLATEAAGAVIKYAFDTLQADSLFAGHNPHNVNSAKVLKKLGFSYVGDAFYAPTGLNHPSYLLKKPPRFRYAAEEDVPLILQFIRELADYEQMLSEVVATEELLREWIFEKQKAEVIFALENGKEVGFALFFHNFSTFLGRSGIYLEDLYVKPEYRSRGYGKGLLKQLAKIAVERGCGRLEWWCLDWNQPSIDFYLSLGAEPMEDWTVYRIAGKTLTELAL